MLEAIISGIFSQSSIVAILGVASGFGLGALRYWKYFKGMKEAIEVLVYFSEALKDGFLSHPEQQKLYKELMDVFKALNLAK